MAVGSDWIWELLAQGEANILEDAHLGNFDWNVTHDDYGTPLVAVIFGKRGRNGCDLVCSTSEQAKVRLRLLKWVFERGSDPNMKTPSTFKHEKSYFRLVKKEERSPMVHLAGKSALESIAEVMAALKISESEWAMEINLCRAALKILTAYRPHEGGVPRVAVALGVVEMWERILNTGQSADVSIVCRQRPEESSATGPSSDCEVVAAHKVVLQTASRVLCAMLSGPFKEGATSQVEVDCGAAPVKLLLAQIYTGEELDDADSPDIVLSSLELAHQWDVSPAVAALEAAAAKGMGDAHFGRAAEIACRLRLQQLAEACRAFAKESQHVRAHFEASEYPAAMQAQLAEVFRSPASAAQSAAGPKRRRIL